MLGLQLESMIFRIFSKLNSSMILFKLNLGMGAVAGGSMNSQLSHNHAYSRQRAC